MTIRTPALLGLAVLALGAAACSQPEQNEAQADANEAAADTGEAAREAGGAIKEEASQLGSAIAAGAKEAAQEVDESTDALARKANEQKAETERDNQGNATPN